MEDLAIRTYDFSPLWRSTIGFDRLFDLVESAQRATEDNYPPYNIERLGGWDGYPSSKPPGPITMKHGLEYFHAAAAGWSLSVRLIMISFDFKLLRVSV